jgi:hypothetical protein
VLAVLVLELTGAIQLSGLSLLWVAAGVLILRAETVMTVAVAVAVPTAVLVALVVRVLLCKADAVATVTAPQILVAVAVAAVGLALLAAMVAGSLAVVAVQVFLTTAPATPVVVTGGEGTLVAVLLPARATLATVRVVPAMAALERMAARALFFLSLAPRHKYHFPPASLKQQQILV